MKCDRCQGGIDGAPRTIRLGCYQNAPAVQGVPWATTAIIGRAAHEAGRDDLGGTTFEVDAGAQEQTVALFKLDVCWECERDLHDNLASWFQTGREILTGPFRGDEAKP